ncbi:Glu/Leu/Phe/Val dehydrogenase dimerization domain-containing protein [Fodinibius saliphilus]|uniref:Glu/Leu/Phe/Val dehydrogenase dimerization domain-containing protein n=1 Tax=Fodinibius saliphilus TaxID=1920650 RepID=UPI001107CF0C|nr:Glu/Leu/Phe/Val dehydrogenase dimerization domain-containing protein [Fodinibius saliphilus]
MESTTIAKDTDADISENFPLFGKLQNYEHEQIVICSEPSLGLKAIIAVHDTTLGPALGGVRMWPYNNEQEAIRDVLRLSRGMTYKAAISGLNLGGGKAVIIGDPRKEKNESLFRAFGRYVDSLGGRYITAEDVGINVQNMEWVRMETKYVSGLPKSIGGSGDPSPVTAYGVYQGMKASAQKAYGSDSLEGKRIAIQGAGHVSSHLANFLSKEGAELFICDIYEDKVNAVAEETGAEVVDPDAIYGLDVDIFSPCALGGVVNDDTMDQFKCDIIAGAANNVLDDEDKHGKMLLENDILYAPDYVINAGGLINVASELEGYNEERAHKQASKIYDTILDILNYSEDNETPTFVASNILAEKRINNVGQIHNIYTSDSKFSGHIGELYKNNV